MKQIIYLILALFLFSCKSTRFGQITSDSRYNKKFSKWLVVEKYEVDDTSCNYYWNRGASSFIDRCDLYEVGDTIKHH